MTPFDIVKLGFYSHAFLFVIGAAFHYFSKKSYEPFSFVIPNTVGLVGCLALLTAYAYTGNFEKFRTLMDFAGAAIYAVTALLWGLGALVSAIVSMSITKLLTAN